MFYRIGNLLKQHQHLGLLKLQADILEQGMVYRTGNLVKQHLGLPAPLGEGCRGEQVHVQVSHLAAPPGPGSSPAAPGGRPWPRSSCAFCRRSAAVPSGGC